MTKININYSWRFFFSPPLARHFISIIFHAYCFHHSSVRSATITAHPHFGMGDYEMNLFRVTKEGCGMCQALKATISAFQIIFFVRFHYFPKFSLSLAVALCCDCQCLMRLPFFWFQFCLLLSPNRLIISCTFAFQCFYQTNFMSIPCEQLPIAKQYFSFEKKKNNFMINTCMYTYVNKNSIYVIGKSVALKRCQIWTKIISYQIYGWQKKKSTSISVGEK